MCRVFSPDGESSALTASPRTVLDLELRAAPAGLKLEPLTPLTPLTPFNPFSSDERSSKPKRRSRKNQAAFDKDRVVMLQQAPACREVHARQTGQGQTGQACDSQGIRGLQQLRRSRSQSFCSSPASQETTMVHREKPMRRATTPLDFMSNAAERLQELQGSVVELHLTKPNNIACRKASFTSTVTPTGSDLSSCETMTPYSSCDGESNGERRPSCHDILAEAHKEALGPITGEWRKGGPIGSGSYGTVFRAQEFDTGRVFAVKRASGDACADPKALDQLRHELEICKSLNHPNIVSYLGHEVSDGQLFIFIEYLAGGSISGVLKEYGALNPRLLRQATLGALQGLHYLHTRNPPVVHRDIKGGNLLVDCDFNVKLADFGCSHQQVATTSFTTVGSIPWMAPEVIQQADGHGRKADIWSLGCTVLEMATAETPWGRGAFDNMVYALRLIAMSDALPPMPETLPAPCRAFIQCCIQRDPSHRLGTAELLQHDFLA